MTKHNHLGADEVGG